MDEMTKRVVDFLKSTGLDAKGISIATGIDRSNVYNILNGKRKAGEGVAHKVAASSLGADLQYLLTGVAGESIDQPDHQKLKDENLELLRENRELRIKIENMDDEITRLKKLLESHGIESESAEAV